MKHQSSIKTTILFYILSLLMYFSAKYQLCIFFSWKMTGRLQLCYSMYELCSKLQLSIWPILFRGKPLYGWNLPHVRWTLQRLATQIWQLNKSDRLRSVIILVWPIRRKVEQESSSRDVCLVFLQYVCFYQGAAGCATL